MRGLGYLREFDPDPPRGQVSVLEADVFTCAHCSRIVELVLKRDIRPERAAFECDAKAVPMCRRCAKFVCPRCAPLGCDPIEAKLGRWEKR